MIHLIIIYRCCIFHKQEEQTLTTYWSLRKSLDKFRFVSAYNADKSQLSTDFVLKYGQSYLDQIDFKLLFKSDIPGWEKMNIDGLYKPPMNSKNTKFILESKAQWAEDENIKLDMMYDSNEAQPSINMTLSSSIFQTNQFSCNANLKKNVKIDAVYSYGKDDYRLNVAIAAAQLTQSSANFILTLPGSRHSVHYKFELESPKKVVLMHLNSRLFPLKIQSTAASRNGRQLMTAIVSIPAVGITEWRFNIDTIRDKTARITLFWAPRRSISLNLSQTRSELSAKLRTPFEFLETFDIICKYDLSKTTFSTTVSLNQKKIEVNASMPSETSIALSIKTPFGGFRKISLDASITLEPDYKVALVYSQDRQEFKLDGKLVVNESDVKVKFDVALNNKKISIETEVKYEYDYNVFIAVTTPFKAYGEMRLDAFLTWHDTTVGLTYKHNQRQLLSLKVTARADSEVSLAVEIKTPFEGFHNISLKISEVSRPVYLAKFTYTHDENKVELMAKYDDGPKKTNTTSADYGGDENYEGYEDPDYDNRQEDYGMGVNATPTEDKQIFALEGVFNDQKMATEIALVTGSSSTGEKFDFSINMETPFDFLSNAKLSTSYEKALAGSREGTWSYRVNGAAEYNDFKVVNGKIVRYNCKW